MGLGCALLCSLLVLPTPAAAANAKSSFNDIGSADMAEAAEVLRVLGIVDGTGNGGFTPGGILTRAQFCKMAVELKGQGDLVAGQMNRTIFKDVPPTHWARGYINVATQGTTTPPSSDDKEATPVTTTGFIRGDAYGNFSPDRPITYAEAITILVRVLGYADKDVGLVWPDGYLAMADALKLTEGVKLKPNDSVTRGQATLLIENLLYINPKDSKTQYLTGSALNCTISEEAVIFAVDAAAPDGTLNAVKTAGSKVYKTDRPAFPDDLVGRRAKLVLDKDGKAVAAQVSDQGTQKVVSVLTPGYNFLKLSGGEEIKISTPATVKIYRDGQEDTTYDKTYLNMAPGTQAVLQYSAAGELEYMFLRSGSKVDNSTRVLKNKPSPAAVEPTYQIFKNGIPAATKDYRQYDVTSFDSVSNTMYVSDTRITGLYENVYPNPQTPATITVMGYEFNVLPSAAADLATFAPGQEITLLLSYTGQVAGAVRPSAAKSTTVGQVESVDKDGKAVVSTLNLRNAAGESIKLTGLTGYTGDKAAEMKGQVVTVSSNTKGRLTLNKLSGYAPKEGMDVANMLVDGAALTPNALFFEHVDTSIMKKVGLEDVTSATVPADKITYVHKNYAGDVDLVLFNDVTGNLYDYGTVSISQPYTTKGTTQPDGTTAQGDRMPGTVSVTNALGATTPLSFTNEVRASGMVGIVARPGGTDLAACVSLKEVGSVPSAAFDMETMTVTTNSAVYSVANNVQCYNRTTDTWFTPGATPTDESYKAALNLARAYSDTMTVYLDKAPEDGGKIRIVVVG